MDGVDFGVGLLCVMGGILIGYVVSLAIEQAILKIRYNNHLKYLHEETDNEDKR